MPRHNPKYYELPVKEFIYKNVFEGERSEIQHIWFDNVPVEIRKKFESVELFFEGEDPIFLSFTDYDNYQMISDMRMVSFRNGERGEVFWKDYKGRTIDLGDKTITIQGTHSNVNIYIASAYEFNFMMFLLLEMHKYLEYHKRKA